MPKAEPPGVFRGHCPHLVGQTCQFASGARNEPDGRHLEGRGEEGGPAGRLPGQSGDAPNRPGTARQKRQPLPPPLDGAHGGTQPLFLSRFASVDGLHRQ